MNTGGTVTLVIFLLLLAGAAAFAGWWFWRKKTKTRRELYAANKSGKTNCHILAFPEEYALQRFFSQIGTRTRRRS